MDCNWQLNKTFSRLSRCSDSRFPAFDCDFNPNNTTCSRSPPLVCQSTQFTRRSCRPQRISEIPPNVTPPPPWEPSEPGDLEYQQMLDEESGIKTANSSATTKDGYREHTFRQTWEKKAVTPFSLGHHNLHNAQSLEKFGKLPKEMDVRVCSHPSKIAIPKRAPIIPKSKFAKCVDYKKLTDPKAIPNPEAFRLASDQNWKLWPPPVPNIPQGVKIPVELVRRVETMWDPNGLSEEIDMGFVALPVGKGPEELFKNLKGLLNQPKATGVDLYPPSVLFTNTRVGHAHPASLQLRNDAKVSRRISVLSPKNSAFDVVWGAGLQAPVSIAPGMTANIWVLFKPREEVKGPINDFFTIVVQGDGALVVPIMVVPDVPPILEMDEWNCGCSELKTAQLCQFEIKNYGDTARFWILNELDYQREYIALPKAGKSKSHANKKGAKNLKLNKETPSISSITSANRMKDATIEKSSNKMISPKSSVDNVMLLEIGGTKRNSLHESRTSINPETLENSKNEPNLKEITSPNSFTNILNNSEAADGETKETTESPENDLEAPAVVTEVEDKTIFDSVFAEPFKIYPACFQLGKKETITINAIFRPKTSGFIYQKLAVLCDNGEVRWIAVRGYGMDSREEGWDETENVRTFPSELEIKVTCGHMDMGEKWDKWSWEVYKDQGAY